MFRKEYIKPGMLVKFHSGEIAIANYEHNHDEDIGLSWNDKSGKSLDLKNYSEDLSYPNHEDISIDEVYGVGSFYDPFNMNTSLRTLLWKRNGNKFSQDEKVTANYLLVILNSFKRRVDETSIRYTHKGQIFIGDEEVSLIIPEKFFPNLKEATTLEAIVNGEVLR